MSFFQEISQNKESLSELVTLSILHTPLPVRPTLSGTDTLNE